MGDGIEKLPVLPHVDDNDGSVHPNEEVDGPMAIGRRLDKAMALADLANQSELARISGVVQPVISRCLSGSAVPKPVSLGKLARTLGVSLEWLLWGEGEEPSEISRPLVLSQDDKEWLSLRNDLGKDDIAEFTEAIKGRQQRNRRLLQDLRRK